MGGRDYRVESGISWTSGLTPAGLLAEGYKRGTVAVSWSDEAGNHSISQTTFIYPGGYGPAADAVVRPSHGVGNPWPPTALAAILPTGLTGQTAVDLSWTPPVSSDPPVAAYDIAYSTDNWATLNQIASATTGSSYRVTNLSAGTTYQFKVRSRSAEGTVSFWFPTASSTPIMTPISIAATCNIGSFVVTPNAVRKKTGADGSKLNENPVVSVNTSGTACTGLYMTYKPTTALSDSVLLTKSLTGGDWRGTVRGSTFAWDVGTKTIDLFNQSGTKLGTTQFTVCDNNAKTCP
jgi:hypothetical protein